MTAGEETSGLGEYSSVHTVQRIECIEYIVLQRQSDQHVYYSSDWRLHQNLGHSFNMCVLIVSIYHQHLTHNIPRRYSHNQTSLALSTQLGSSKRGLVGIILHHQPIGERGLGNTEKRIDTVRRFLNESHIITTTLSYE